MLLAMALMPLSDALAKSLVSDFSAEQISFFRNVTHALVLLPIVVLSSGWRAILAAFNTIQLLRTLCFVSMTVCYVAGLKWTPMAEAMATVFLFPILVLIGSALFFKEKINLTRWAAALIGFIGVVIVARASFSSVGIGLVWIFAAVLSTAAYLLLTKLVSAQAPILVLGLIPALIGSTLLLPPAALTWQTPSWSDMSFMMLVGLIAAVAHLLIVYAYSRSDASLIAPLAYIQIIAATLYGFILFNEMPNSSTWLGIATIVISEIFLAGRAPNLLRGKRSPPS